MVLITVFVHARECVPELLDWLCYPNERKCVMRTYSGTSGIVDLIFLLIKALGEQCIVGHLLESWNIEALVRIRAKLDQL